MRLIVATSLSLIACGSVDSKVNDAAVDSVAPDVATDAFVTPPRCDPSAPFGAGVPVTELNSADQENFVWLTADELTAYLSSNRSGGVGGYDIWVAARTSITGTFSTPELLGTVNTAADESRPTLSADGLTLFASQYQTEFKIVSTTRTSTSLAFGTLTNVDALNDPTPTVYDADVMLAASGNAYFASARGANTNLFYATRNGASFNQPAVLNGTTLSDAGFDGCAVISPDEKTIVFCSNRAGGAGGLDMYISQRTTTVEAFPAVSALTTLNTAGAEQSNWISADGCVLYYATGTSQADIYVATRGM
jgi:Tol biopolymer transport system component